MPKYIRNVYAVMQSGYVRKGSCVQILCSGFVSCAGRVHSIPILFAVSVLILVWIGGFVKEVVFDWGLSGNSLFSGIMERLPVMLLGWYAGKDTTGEDALLFFCLVKNKK